MNERINFIKLTHGSPLDLAGAVSLRGLDIRAVSRSPLLWLNLVCLDAPLVAISWQWLLASSFHVTVPTASGVALFLTSWLIYLVDRYADSTSLPLTQPKSVRQEFCSHHKSIWLVLIICVAILDGIIVLRDVDYETAVRGAILGAITIAYVAINYGCSKLWKTVPLKEIAIGSLFAAGTLVTVAPHVLPQRSTIILAAALFAGLCSLNCISIATWERELDRMQDKHSIATRWPAANYFASILMRILVPCCVLLPIVDDRAWPVAVCLGLSAMLLRALHVAPVSRDERTALADLVLLTPLALLFAEKVL